MDYSALRVQTHPLNFFAGLAGSMKSDGESPCENRDNAHKTYLSVSLLSYDVLPHSDEQSSLEVPDETTYFRSLTPRPESLIPARPLTHMAFNASQLSACGANLFSAPLPMILNKSAGVGISSIQSALLVLPFPYGLGSDILVGRSGAFASALGVDENDRVAVYASLDDDACRLSSIV